MLPSAAREKHRKTKVGDTVLAKLGKLNEEASTLEGESQKAKESDMEMGRQVPAWLEAPPKRRGKFAF